jgi:glycosyltransferase involved in cell wall biosynthesis
MLVSIIITNFNYARYLPVSIESALGQTHPQVEVIVVNDGSTDDSREVLARFEDRVTCVFKENRGQASAFNEGFRVAGGDVVIFLDADDLLFPDTAAAVVRAFRRDRTLAKIQYRLEVIDAEGRPTGQLMPPASIRLPEGNLTDLALRSPDDVPSTGNAAFPAGILRRLLPIPEETWPDMYLVNLAPLLGPVATLDGIGGRYRVHGANFFARETLDLDRMREALKTTALNHRYLSELALSLGLVDSRDQLRFSSVTNLAQRVMSLKLERRLHPIAGDRVSRLAAEGIAAAWRRPDLAPSRRVLYTAWFAAMVLAPRGQADWLARRLFSAWKAGSARPAVTATPR